MTNEPRNVTTIKFAVGDMLSRDEAISLAGTRDDGCGWFTDYLGRKVYICDGSHRDGTRGYKVLQIGKEF